MQLIQGFMAVFHPVTLSLIIGGVVAGIVFGAIPGLSAFTALALFLPITFGMEPVNGIAFLISIYVGGVSGGLISAILLGIPGTPSSRSADTAPSLARYFSCSRATSVW